MNEMLANRYLRTRRYGDALPFLEYVVRTHPERIQARQKLALCYVLTGHVPESMALAADLVANDAPVGEELAAIAARVIDGLRQRERVLSPATFHAAMAVALLHIDPDLTHALAELDAAIDASDAPSDASPERLRAVVQARIQATKEAG